jgi:hypothetical protein
VGLFETQLTTDDLTDGRGFPQSFHINARILRTLLSSRFPTNPYRFIMNCISIIIPLSTMHTALLVQLAHNLGHSPSPRLSHEMQLNPTPAHASVFNESLFASAVCRPSEGRSLQYVLTDAPWFIAGCM